MNMVLLGPPGAGKGTQAKKIAKTLSLAHVSTGDILRENVKQDTQLGRQAKDFMDRGALVPDELVAQMLDARLDGPDVKKGFILDGYPRNISQAKTLDGLLEKKGAGIDLVIYLYASEPVIIQRLTGRLVCSVCGANFHVSNMPPKTEGICDCCGGNLIQRSDDKEETVKKRIKVYNDEVASLKDYYEKKERLFPICADIDADEVLKKIVELAKKSDGPHKE